MAFRYSWLAFAVVAVFVAGFLLVAVASADVAGTLLTGSTGTLTLSLNSEFFNNDPAALPGTCTTSLGRGCNSDVATNTTLSFIGGPLTAGEGIYVNNNDLNLTPPSALDVNRFLTFASNPDLVFSINWPPGPGSPNTNCATANANGLSCSIFAGSPIVLTYINGDTALSFGVTGKASDTGVAGLAAGSNYAGGFFDIFTVLLPNATAPTPQNIQLYFCPSGVCQAADFSSGKSITTAESGTFTATPPASAVPEPSSLLLSFLGAILMPLAAALLKFCEARA